MHFLAQLLRNIHHHLAEIHADDLAPWGNLGGYRLRVLDRVGHGIENMFPIRRSRGRERVACTLGRRPFSVEPLVGSCSLIVCVLSLCLAPVELSDRHSVW